VHKISIIPRGIAALGYTQQLPEHERYLLRERELLDRLAVLLGGRAAEALVFGEISTGAGNDLERATDIAHRMVTEYGMSERLGPVSLDGADRSAFLEQRVPMPKMGRGMSNETAHAIDGEVRRIVVDALDRATGLLRRERDSLDRLAALLLEREVVDRSELRELLGEARAESEDARLPEVGHVPDAG
jgi:cell division protease FtsH